VAGIKDARQDGTHATHDPDLDTRRELGHAQNIMNPEGLKIKNLLSWDKSLDGIV
jgi:hypothetical protein